MKVVAINGSPRKGGNTEILLKKALMPLAAAGWDGALDVEIFSTPELFWGLPAAEAARRAYAAASALIG